MFPNDRVRSLDEELDTCPAMVSSSVSPLMSILVKPYVFTTVSVEICQFASVPPVDMYASWAHLTLPFVSTETTNIASLFGRSCPVPGRSSDPLALCPVT